MEYKRFMVKAGYSTVHSESVKSKKFNSLMYVRLYHEKTKQNFVKTLKNIYKYDIKYKQVEIKI